MDNPNLENRVLHLEEELKKLKGFLIKSDTGSGTKISKKLSIKEFLITKKIDNDVHRTVAIAYFLEKFEALESFNIDDLKRCYQLAKHPLSANPNDKVNMAIKNGHIMEAVAKKGSKKAWTLTATGEKFVENNFHLTKQ